VHQLARLATADSPVTAIAVWVIVAFATWVALTDAIGRLHVPRPAFVAAPLSWIAARLLIWAATSLLHQVDLPSLL
jgi:hypothetical protein